MAEQDYSDLIAVREVTDVHANWSEEGSDVPGKFSFQLILNDGAAEHVVRPDAKASKVLLELIAAARASCSTRAAAW